MSLLDWLRAQFAPAAPEVAAMPPVPAVPVPSEPVQPIAPPAPALPQISARSVDMMIGFEISSPAYYDAKLQHPIWPGGGSGVTGGIGYDFGYEPEADIRAEWGPYLSPDDLDRLITCCGLTGLSAHSVLSSVQGIVLPLPAATAVFRQASLPKYLAQTLAAFPGAAGLSPDSLGALVSLIYNRGPGMAVADDRRREMRQIAQCLPTHPELVPDLIRSMKRLWSDKQGNPLPGMAGLLTRRDAEAALFADGLRAAETATGDPHA